MAGWGFGAPQARSVGRDRQVGPGGRLALPLGQPYPLPTVFHPFIFADASEESDESPKHAVGKRF